MTGSRGAEAGHRGGSSVRAAGGGSTTPASQGSRALSRAATSDATVKPGPRRTVPGWRRGTANAVMHCRSHSGAHSGFTGAPRGSGGNVHMNGRRSTRPSGSASDEEDVRDCKPAGFTLSTPSGEGATGDGGFLPKLSRRRFPSPFSLSRICSIGGARASAARRKRAAAKTGDAKVCWPASATTSIFRSRKPHTTDRTQVQVQTGSATLDALSARVSGLDGDERKASWQARGLAQEGGVVSHGTTSGVVGHLLQNRDATQAPLLLLVPAERGGALSCKRGADRACKGVLWRGQRSQRQGQHGQ